MGKKPVIYTKQSLINKLKEIAEMGWIPNARRGNAGGIGNTLEDLLGIEENNLPMPNAAEWELKTIAASRSVCATSAFTKIRLASRGSRKALSQK